MNAKSSHNLKQLHLLLQQLQHPRQRRQRLLLRQPLHSQNPCKSRPQSRQQHREVYSTVEEDRVRQNQPHPLWEGIPGGSRFYFVHSYYIDPREDALVAGITDYGIPFTSVIARDNLFAAQFHPEKSAAAGLRLLRNFIYWDV